MNETNDNLDKLANRAITALDQFLSTEGEFAQQQLVAARVAASVLSSWTRHKQTEGAREATTFMMARELARDKEELRRYIEVSMPTAPILKGLPAPVAARRGKAGQGT